MGHQDSERTILFIVKLLKNIFCNRLIVKFTQDLECFFFYCRAFINKVVISQTFPYFRGVFFLEDLLDDVTDD